MKKEVITIDLGSNSFRVLKYDCLTNKSLKEFNKVVGLADGLIDTGFISKEAQNRVVEAMHEAMKQISFKSSKVVALTTAAMRKASNSYEVLNYFKEETGIEFKIIDGQEEARLTLLAVKNALKRENIDSEKFVLLDIGGGSTEIVINDGENYKAKSFDFGIVTLTQKYESLVAVQNDLKEKQLLIETFLNSLNIDLKNYTFVSTAGTPTTIAAIKLGQDFFSYDKNLVNGQIVEVKDLDKCLKIFRDSSIEEIIKLVGKGRVEFIEVGILIYKMIFKALNKNESVVFDDGLREGIAVNYCLLN